MLKVELGCAGHFIAARECSYRRHTQVGNYRVSSVGELHFEGKEGRQEVGLGRFFETMVFRTTDEPAEGSEGCGCREVASWTEIDFDSYQTAGEAQAGHEAMVEKYMKLASKPAIWRKL